MAGLSASSSTRSLKASHDSSRLMKCSGLMMAGRPRWARTGLVVAPPRKVAMAPAGSSVIRLILVTLRALRPGAAFRHSALCAGSRVAGAQAAVEPLALQPWPRDANLDARASDPAPCQIELDDPDAPTTSAISRPAVARRPRAWRLLRDQGLVPISPLLYRLAYAAHARASEPGASPSAAASSLRTLYLAPPSDSWPSSPATGRSWRAHGRSATILGLHGSASAACGRG